MYPFLHINAYGRVISHLNYIPTQGQVQENTLTFPNHNHTRK